MFILSDQKEFLLVTVDLRLIVNNLSIITSGPLSPNPSESLNSKRMSAGLIGLVKTMI